MDLSGYVKIIANLLIKKQEHPQKNGTFIIDYIIFNSFDYF